MQLRWTSASILLSLGREPLASPTRGLPTVLARLTHAGPITVTSYLWPDFQLFASRLDGLPTDSEGPAGAATTII